MILLTVGMQLGFDRLVKAMDDLAPELGMEVIAQTGKGAYRPRNMIAREKIAPEEFEGLVRQCRLVVSHAGIGTVLTAQRFSRPILLFPRRFEMGEHRNDHQVATVQNLEGRSGILVAYEADELRDKIANGLTLDPGKAPVSPSALQLRQTIGRFIESGEL